MKEDIFHVNVARKNIQKLNSKIYNKNSKWQNTGKSVITQNINKTDSLEIIERAMDMQQILYQFSELLNSYFRFQLLIVILTAFIIIVFDSYYVLFILVHPDRRKLKLQIF